MATTGKVTRGATPPEPETAAKDIPQPRPATPSEKILAEASDSFTVTDSKGRLLACNKLGLLDQMRLIDIVGPDTAQNAVYMMMAGMLCSVRSIDGEPESPPRTKLELEAKIQRIGEDGLVAIRDELERQGEQLGEEAERAQVRK